jgi:hypothetical protein
LPGSALKVCVVVGWWCWWGGVGWLGSTQLCGHPNFVLGWSWVVTIREHKNLPLFSETPLRSSLKHSI